MSGDGHDGSSRCTRSSLPTKLGGMTPLYDSYHKYVVETNNNGVREALDANGQYCYADTVTSYYPFTRLIQGEYELHDEGLVNMSPILGVYSSIDSALAQLMIPRTSGYNASSSILSSLTKPTGSPDRA
jgi:hypothetical protein